MFFGEEKDKQNIVGTMSLLKLIEMAFYYKSATPQHAHFPSIRPFCSACVDVFVFVVVSYNFPFIHRPKYYSDLLYTTKICAATNSSTNLS